MKFSPSKESILKKIRKALSHSTPLPFPQSEVNQPVFPSSSEELEVVFAEQFNALGGRFIFCVNRQELAFQFNSLIKKSDWQKVYCIENKIKEIVGTAPLVYTGHNLMRPFRGAQWLLSITDRHVANTIRR